MQTDAFGRLLDIDAPETVRCTACDGRAERLSSAWQSEGVAYYNYQCRTESCPAGGTIVEHESTDERRVGPVFRVPRSHHPTRRADHPVGSVRGYQDDNHEPEKPAEKPLEADV